jgi:uncharacterized membrane protein YdbT with pleckstrin-like domain
MNSNSLGKPIRTFQFRPSAGWFWLILIAAIIIAVEVAPTMAMGVASSSAVLMLIICISVAFAFLILAIWFPTMRYELTPGQLTLRYGPILTYWIPLVEIRTSGVGT